MTPEHEASRTLVKSPPELWAELSDPAALARHLSDFGEIRITRLEPETAVAWEGERARGTVRLEPSGWGTRVVLTARAEVPSPPAPTPTPPAPTPPTPGPDPSPPGPGPDPGPPGPGPDPAPPRPGPVPGPPVPGPQPGPPVPGPQPGPPVPGPEPSPPGPEPSPLPPAAKRRGARSVFARLWAFLAAPPVEAPVDGGISGEPADREALLAEDEAGQESVAERELAEAHDVPELPDSPTRASLRAALDSLGQAHHRPYSRA